MSDKKTKKTATKVVDKEVVNPTIAELLTQLTEQLMCQLESIETKLTYMCEVLEEQNDILHGEVGEDSECDEFEGLEENDEVEGTKLASYRESESEEETQEESDEEDAEEVEETDIESDAKALQEAVGSLLNLVPTLTRICGMKVIRITNKP